MKIALVSSKMRNRDVNKQINQIQSILMNLESVDLICFCEGYLQGFGGLSWRYEIDKDIALKQDSSEIQSIQMLAITYNTAISFGYYEMYQGNIYCSNMVIDQEGHIVNNYRRRSRGWKENFDDVRYQEGDHFSTFSLKGKQFVSAICGDLWYQDLIGEIETLGEKTDAVLWPLYIDYDVKSWEESVKLEYQTQVKNIPCKVLMINGYESDGSQAQGGAYVFNKGYIVDHLDLGIEGVLVFAL